MRRLQPNAGGVDYEAISILQKALLVSMRAYPILGSEKTGRLIGERRRVISERSCGNRGISIAA